MPGSPAKPTNGRFAHGNQCVFCPHRTHCSGAQIELADRAGQAPGISISRRQLKRGQSLYWTGDLLTQIYFVYNGALKTCTNTGVAEARITDFVLPGELIGLDALFEAPSRYDAVAIEDSNLCAVSLPARLSALDPAAPAFRAVFGQLRDKLLHLEWRVAVQQLSAERRIAAFVLEFCVRRTPHKPGQQEFRLSMSHSDLGNYLGLAPETTSRAFSRLQRRGVLSSRGHRLRVHDLETLRRLGEPDGAAIGKPPRLRADSA